MKKMMMMFLSLALLSLACLETSSNELPITELTAVATRIKKVATFTAPAMVKITISTAEPETCAEVIADTAQNLRIEPGATSRILTWLKNGDVVRVLEQTSADWWHVKRGDDVGFARSIYLDAVECAK